MRLPTTVKETHFMDETWSSLVLSTRLLWKCPFWYGYSAWITSLALVIQRRCSNGCWRRSQYADVTRSLRTPPYIYMRGSMTIGFIGESGAHSFLEQIWQIFRKNSGESAFTQDIQRFNMVDGPSHHASQWAVQLPSPTRRDELINLFEINVQPFAYVFHMDDFRQMIQET
jgi:hypothetical protein